MITEINFDEFVNMVAALPPTYEVPSIAKRCRDYADEVAERRGNRARRSRLHGLGRFPLASADFWTSDHPSERSRGCFI
jgi:hypothetical protein